MQQMPKINARVNNEKYRGSKKEEKPCYYLLQKEKGPKNESLTFLLFIKMAVSAYIRS